MRTCRTRKVATWPRPAKLRHATRGAVSASRMPCSYGDVRRAEQSGQGVDAPHCWGPTSCSSSCQRVRGAHQGCSGLLLVCRGMHYPVLSSGPLGAAQGIRKLLSTGINVMHWLQKQGRHTLALCSRCQEHSAKQAKEVCAIWSAHHWGRRGSECCLANGQEGHSRDEPHLCVLLGCPGESPSELFVCKKAHLHFMQKPYSLRRLLQR